MEFPFIVFAWGVGFAITACLGLILSSAKLTWLQRTPTAVLAGGAAIAAVLAIRAPAHPTGYAALDLLMRCAFAAVLAAAVARARRRIRLVVTLLLAAPMVLAALDLVTGAAQKWVLATAVATAGAAAASYLFPERVAWIGSIVGVGASVTALRLPQEMVSLVPSAISAAALFFACASAWVTLRTPARRVVRRTCFAVFGLAFIAGAAGVVALINARASAERGLDDARTGLAAASNGDATAANTAFVSASSALRTASAQLDGKYARLGRSLPVLSQHITVLRDLTGTASAVTETASIAAGQADLEQLRVEGGRIDLDKLKQLGVQINAADGAIVAARNALGRSKSPWIVSPLRDRIDSLGEQITTAETASAQVREILTVIPPMFGGNGARRYMLVLSNPSELRSSGGVMGNYGELTAVNGTLSLSRFGRTADLYAGGVPVDKRTTTAPADYLARYTKFGAPQLWSNANFSPDFPTVAQTFAEQFQQALPPVGAVGDAANSAGVDGVISIDPVTLQALLGVLGPLEVEGWDEPLTGENTARVLMHDAYVTKGGATPERLNLLSEVTLGVWQKLTTVQLPTPKVLADALAPSARRRHLQVWMRADLEQRYIERIGLAGAIPTVEGDSLGIFLNNASESKIDFFLQRRTKVAVTLNPADATIKTVVEIALQNTAPAAGEPPYILGTGALNPVGSLRYYVSIYSPLPLVRANATLDGKRIDVSSMTELGRNAYAIWLVVPNGATRTISLELSGKNPLGAGDYRLDLLNQALVNDDPVELTVTSADGSVLTPLRGFGDATPDPQGGAGQVQTFAGQADSLQRFEVGTPR